MILLNSLIAVSLAANPLDDALSSYHSMEYERCLKQATQASKLAASTEEAAKVHVLRGLCTLALGKESAAQVQFETALKLDPNAGLVPNVSPRVKSFFEEIRVRVVPEAARQPTTTTSTTTTPPVQDVPKVENKVADLTPPPQPPPLVVVNENPPIPPPTPQKSWVVPAVLGGAGLVGMGVFAYFGLRARSLEVQARDAVFESEQLALIGEAKNQALIANLTLGVSSALLVAAVLTYFLQ